MPFNGSGVFSPVFNWTNDANNGIKILASRQDTQWNDVCTNGLSDCITRDGQSPATANIPLGTFKITNLGNGTAATDAAAFGQLSTAQGQFRGFLGGLTLSAAGSTGTFGIAKGVATDSTASGLMTLASAFTKTTANFVAGTAAGALDVGSIANTTWYHVYLIGDPLLPGDILFSLSASAPTLPAGYTIFRYIGSMLTDSSAHWVKFFQSGNTFLWSVSTYDIQGVTPTTVARTLYPLTVPTGVIVTAMFRANFEPSVDGVSLIFTSPNESDQAPGGNAAGADIGFGLANAVTAGRYNVLTDTSSQIGARASGTATAGLQVSTFGWIDTRGQG